MKNLKSNQQTLLLVLGMHRSGTSMCTGVINELGVSLATRALGYTGEDNKKGYFEDLNLAILQDQFLRTLGSHWADTNRIDQKLINQHNASIVHEIRNYLTNEFLNTDILAIKDPRICILLNFWLTAADQLNLRVKTLIIYRNPEEVGSSLLRRDNIPEVQSNLLWAKHYLSVLSQLKRVDYQILFFDEIASNRDVITEALKKLSINLQYPNCIDDVFDQNLINNTAQDLKSLSTIQELKNERLSLTNQEKILNNYYKTVSETINIEDYNNLVRYTYETLNDSADNLRKIRNYEWLLSRQEKADNRKNIITRILGRITPTRATK